MKRSSQKGLTPLELRIMQAIWHAGGGTVADVQARLEPEMAYTTVQTMLNILVRKGKLKRALDGRAYVYTAKETEERAVRQGVRDLVDRMFGGSSEELVMTLLKSREIDAEKLAELSRRFDGEEGGE
ncbi:MAG TPA: BlaI/MecI/CopY family transcriptional regulator [Terracidiphilus sp.]|nr:BlaI/MecI/CopY family transcriptional regulator [Terracidiphilus sp.]